ncbi:MAG TPA: ring-cleaving dioxygenase [Opitutaceae bacterium]|nr:ring-cleaving dioxygenase [Opitutaceae bacterium]
MSNQAINGLHHVTAICGDPQRNFAFYTGVLGLRFVKKTVNFDDPGSYHLYYADGAATPGSVLTFFPFADTPQGRDGTGQVSATAYATTEAGLEYWQTRLKEHGVEFRGPMQRFDEVLIAFEDPDGLKLEIVVADQSAAFKPWPGSPVPAAMQLSGFHSVTLAEAGYERTQALLTTQMGWKLLRQSGDRYRYQAPGAGPASIVDILCQPGARHGLQGSGTVHHVAFRVDDDPAELAWRAKLTGFGHNVSPVMDRSYFHSIYYREPGGILFEIATNNPGFTVDEAPDALGSALKLPPQFEPIRKEIEAHLPPLTSAATQPGTT